MNDLVPPLAAALASGMVTTLAIFSVSRYEAWTRKHSIFFVGFAAGVLIAISLLHIIPRALGICSTASYFVLIGFFGLCATHLGVDRLAGDTPNSSRSWKTSILFLIGIGFHSFLDGIIYSVTFSFDTLTGMLSAVGLILHEFPEGVITFVLLKRGGFGQRQAVIYSLLAAAATTPAGTLISYPLIRRVAFPELGALLALAAGALLYVGASHLLPDVEAERRGIVYLALAAGVLLAVSSGVLNH